MRITLCGSTRFTLMFSDWNARLSKAGHVVFTVAAPAGVLTEADKDTLDLVHLKKIDASDAIFVLDGIVDGKPYVGAATRRDILWARLQGKGVFYFSNGGGARLLQMLRAAPLTAAALAPDAGLASVAPEDRKGRADVLVEALAGRVVLEGFQDAEAERMLGAIVSGLAHDGVIDTLSGRLAAQLEDLGVVGPVEIGGAPETNASRGPSAREVAAVADVRGGE